MEKKDIRPEEYKEPAALQTREAGRRLSADLMQTVDSGKKNVVKLVFGRTAVILLLMLFQILGLVTLGMFLEKYLFIAVAANTVLAVVLVMGMIYRSGTPELKMPWMFITLVFPMVGSIMYLFVHMQPGSRVLNRKVLAQKERMRRMMPANDEVMEQLKAADPLAAGTANYLRDKGYPPFFNNGLTYYPLGDLWLPELLYCLRQARSFIFLEFFIIEHGKVWDQVLEVLKDKAAEGVQVRLMYDGTVQFASLTHQYPRLMANSGISCRVFSPMKPALSTYQNHRDHRKIAIIDGEIAFTGGPNLADEYINEKNRFGHWKDTAVMVRGSAVRSLTTQFLQLWDLDGMENDYSDYLDVYPRVSGALYPGYVIPFADNPLSKERIGKFVYMQILAQARAYVHIMTPYLVLDHDMITALCDAVRRGVKVRVILPHIPDKKYAFALARSHYRELIRAGVELYEYLPGFVHAKTFVSDDRIGVVGTINLDYRSLFLHFENAVLLYDVPQLRDMQEDFTDTLEHCRQVDEAFLKEEISFGCRLLGWLLKIIAPLM